MNKENLTRMIYDALMQDDQLILNRDRKQRIVVRHADDDTTFLITVEQDLEDDIT